MRYTKIGGEKRLLAVNHRGRPRKASLRCSMSCPNLVPRAKVYVPLRHISPCRTKPVRDETKSKPCAACSDRPSANIAGCSDRSSANIAGTIAAACKCPCPFPCGPCGNCCGCNCLPPPCNCPPKCIQYMTGYYYYPYGFWFCGPYHVSGCCCPVGPCGSCPCPCPKCCLVPGALSSMGAATMTAAVTNTFKDSPNKDYMNQQMPQNPSMPQTPLPFSQMPQMPRQMPQYPWQMPSAPPFQSQQCAPAKQLTPDDKKSAISKFFPFSTTALPGQVSSSSSPLDKSFHLNNTVKTGAKATTSWTGTNSRSYNTSSGPKKQPTPPEYHQMLYKFCAALPKQAGAEFSQLQPRHVPTAEERDRPTIRPGAFDFTSVPKYRNPYPEPVDFKFKHKENK